MDIIKFKTNLARQMIIGSGKYPKNDYSNVAQYVLQLRLNLYLYMLNFDNIFTHLCRQT